jgi:uncharacterized protein YegL
MNTKQVWTALAGFVFGLMLIPLANAQEPVDNVVIVLDASGSMSRPLPGSKTDKMSAAKSALKEVLKSVPQETHIGLVVFSAKGVDTDWIYPLGPRDDARLMRVIDQPMPGGDTPLGAYIKKGADRLLEERAKQFGYGTFRLLVVTDGEATDQQLMERYTPEVIARGITVDAIGVAMNQRHTLATKVHSYRSANDPASLKRAVAEVFAEVGGRGNDIAGTEAFDQLKSIPTEIAQAMIQSLSSSGNQPIGEKARANPPSSASTTSQGSQPAPIVATGTSSATSRVTVVKRIAVLPLIGGLSCFGLFGLVILVLIFRAAKKTRR